MNLPTWDGRRFHYRRSLASRVTLLTTIAVGVAVAFVALGAYATARVQMQATLDQSLLDRAHAAAQGGLIQRMLNSDYRVSSGALGAGDIRMYYIDQSGTPISVDRGPTLDFGAPEAEVLAGQQDKAIRTIEAESIRYRVVTVPTEEGGALVLAQSLGPQDRVLEKLGLVMLLFGLAGVIAAGLAGWAVARNGLRPVRRLTESVEEIARTERLTPLPVEGDDEVARLAGAFNSLVSSVDGSRVRQRQLVADAGHELRTPLTSLRTNLDLLSQADDSGGLPAEARAELLGDVRAQIEELTTLIGDLIELAREEPAAPVVEAVDLAEVVERAIARVRLRAPGITFESRLHRWLVQGESSALERAVTNLLDNAAKWSPQEGRVTVRLNDGLLSVADQGPGITDKDLPHVFDRFYRSTESRAMPGSGLGLSIVRQVAERHGGTTKAASGPDGGALFTVRIPGTAG
jgi:two-component system sensor histidine kinase MprB